MERTANRFAPGNRERCEPRKIPPGIFVLICIVVMACTILFEPAIMNRLISDGSQDKASAQENGPVYMFARSVSGPDLPPGNETVKKYSALAFEGAVALVWLLSAFWIYRNARGRGLNPYAWLCVGVLLGPLALLIYGFIKPRDEV